MRQVIIVISVVVFCLGVAGCMTAGIGHSPQVLSPGQTEYSFGLIAFVPQVQTAMPFGNIYYDFRRGLWHGTEAELRLMAGDAPPVGVRLGANTALVEGPVLVTATAEAGAAIAPGTQSGTINGVAPDAKPLSIGIEAAAGLLVGSPELYAGVQLSYEADFYGPGVQQNLLPAIILGASFGGQKLHVVPEIGLIVSPWPYFYLPAWCAYLTVGVGFSLR